MHSKIHDLIDAIRKGQHLDAWTECSSRLPAAVADELAVLPVYVLAQHAAEAMSDDLIEEADRLLALGALPCPHGAFVVEFDIVAPKGVVHIVATVNAHDPIEIIYSIGARGLWISDLSAIRLRSGRTEVALTRDARLDPLQMANLEGRTRVVNDVVKTLLAALAVRGAEAEAVEAPVALNKARAKKGRPPIREYTAVRSLTLPRPAPVPAERRGGTHASPVPHHRSGCSFVRRDGRVISRRPTVVNAHLLAPGQVPPAPRVSVSMR